MGDEISSGNTLRLQMMCQIADSFLMFLTAGIHLGAVVGAGVALEAGHGVAQQQQQQHGWVTGSPECRQCVTVTPCYWHTLANIGVPHVMSRTF